MMVLVDHDLEGYARRIWGVLNSEGWLDLLSLPMTTFRDEGLPINSNDRLVWRYAQARGMLLLTGNRNMDGDNSLEQTLREGPMSNTFGGRSKWAPPSARSAPIRTTPLSCGGWRRRSGTPASTSGPARAISAASPASRVESSGSRPPTSTLSWWSTMKRPPSRPTRAWGLRASWSRVIRPRRGRRTERLIEQYPEHPATQFALIRLAALLIQKLNQPHEGVRYLDQFLRQFPNSRWAEGARQERERLAQPMGPGF